MRQFHTIVLERRMPLGTGIYTEPYETGWASEATFYVRVHDGTEAGQHVYCTIQTSVDGIVWVDMGERTLLHLAPGDHRFPITHFDGWLRLAVTPESQQE